MVKFLTFLNNSRKIEGVTNEGTPYTQRISVVDPTLGWLQKIFLEPKQFFALGACLGAYSPKSKIRMTLVFLLTTESSALLNISKKIKNRFVGS